MGIGLLLFAIGSYVAVQASSVVEVPSYRSPSSCERNMCVAEADYCLATVEGIYRFLGGACASGDTCTLCSRDAGTDILTCTCEHPPSTVPAEYGASCSWLNECSEGECFRPCSTFGYIAYCPSGRCFWNYEAGECEDVVHKPDPVLWNLLAPYGSLRPSEKLRGEFIVKGTSSSVFPLEYSALRLAVAGYYVQGSIRLSGLISLDVFFLMLDTDNDKQISEEEFAQLPGILDSLVVTDEEGESPMIISTRRLASSSSTSAVPTPGDLCRLGEPSPGYFCEISSTCVTSCSDSCSWLNTDDPSSGNCVVAAGEVCLRLGNLFCAQTKLCVADCVSGCASGNFTVPDFVSGQCVQAWWGVNVPSPDPATWICRNRKYADQSCRSDMDCIGGKKICTNEICQPVPEGSACVSDRDCGHLGFFCDDGLCATQKKFGSACYFDAQCAPGSLSNGGVCRGYFSLSHGSWAKSHALCQSGVITEDGICSNQFVSKRLGQPCVSDWECPTTEPTGSLGECKCMQWWSDPDVSCKTCHSVSGDLANHGELMRNYYSLKSALCGSVWSDAECVAESDATVQFAYLSYMCEIEKLDGIGVSSGLNPNAGCGAMEVYSACAELETLFPANR